MLGPSSPGQANARSVHHQYSSSVSPFQAYTGTPSGSDADPPGPTATAAAAASWVEKMLHEAHRTRAPRATSVSMSTAVCTVMCSDPVMRAPARGWAAAYSRRTAIRPGISCSARWISLRPNAARDRSATLKSCDWLNHSSCGPLQLGRCRPTQHIRARTWSLDVLGKTPLSYTQGQGSPGSVVAGRLRSRGNPQSRPAAGKRIHVRQPLVAEHGAAYSK